MNQLCRVCGEPAAGFHFGAFTCEGCKVSWLHVDDMKLRRFYGCSDTVRANVVCLKCDLMVNVKADVLWDVTPCCLVQDY